MRFRPCASGIAHAHAQRPDRRLAFAQVPNLELPHLKGRRKTLRKLLLGTFVIVFATAAWVGTADAKSRAACLKIVSSKPDLMTAGGRCGEMCREAVSRCTKGKRI
jgi:hypothetical protein